MFSQDLNTNTAVELKVDRVRAVQGCGQLGIAKPASGRPEGRWLAGLAIAALIALIRLLWWRLDWT